MFTDREKKAARRLLEATNEFNLAAKAARAAGLHYETSDLSQRTFGGDTSEIAVAITKVVTFEEPSESQGDDA